jgi:hypothetical protein
MLQKSIFEIHDPLLPTTALLPVGDRSRKELTLTGCGTLLAAWEESRQAPPCLFFSHGACCELKFPLFWMFHTNVSNFHMDFAKRYEMSRMLHMCIACVASVLPECRKQLPCEDESQLEADRLGSQEACFSPCCNRTFHVFQIFVKDVSSVSCGC